MISKITKARKEKSNDLVRWHRKFFFLKTGIHLEAETGTVNVVCDTVLRRWSETYGRWMYARVGTQKVGRRYVDAGGIHLKTMQPRLSIEPRKWWEIAEDRIDLIAGLTFAAIIFWAAVR